MQPGQATFLDQLQRIVEMRLGLGREARDDVGAKGDVRTQPPGLLAKGNGIIAQVATFHPFQD